MIKPMPPFPETAAPKMHAFVLRVRGQGQPAEDRSIVELEDVRTCKTFRFMQLEQAFQHIRQTLDPPKGTRRKH